MLPIIIHLFIPINIAFEYVVNLVKLSCILLFPSITLIQSLNCICYLTSSVWLTYLYEGIEKLCARKLSAQNQCYIYVCTNSKGMPTVHLLRMYNSLHTFETNGNCTLANNGSHFTLVMCRKVNFITSYTCTSSVSYHNAYMCTTVRFSEVGFEGCEGFQFGVHYFKCNGRILPLDSLK